MTTFNNNKFFSAALSSGENLSNYAQSCSSDLCTDLWSAPLHAKMKHLSLSC